MAVTIISQPTSPNAAYASLIYEVSSSNAQEPQFSYVLDIYESGSSERISRLLQTPNPEGVAEFNPAGIFQGHLDYGAYWTGSYQTRDGIESLNMVFPETSKNFIVKFGEVYGTSISSSITFYPDLTSSSLWVFPGVWDGNNPNDRIFKFSDDQLNFNFPSSSFLTTTSSFFESDVLSDDPFKLTYVSNVYPDDVRYETKVIGPNDYDTVSFFATEFTGSQISPDDISPNYFRLEVYNGQKTIDISSQAFAYGETGSLSQGELVHFGIGPQNIKGLSGSAEAASDTAMLRIIDAFEKEYWTNYRVIVEYGRNQKYHIINYINEAYAFNNTLNNLRDNELDYHREITSDQKLRFAFINRYGVYDYYNCYGVLKRETSNEKYTVSLPKVDYSSAISTYSIENGGDKSYHVNTNDSYSITTNYLDQEMSNWLEQLIESPEVYIQQGDKFVPIVLTNQNYTHNNSENRNKLFNYTLEFTPSNGRILQADDVQCVILEPIPVTYKINTTIPIKTTYRVQVVTPVSQVPSSSIYWGESFFTKDIDYYGESGSREGSKLLMYSGSTFPVRTLFTPTGSTGDFGGTVNLDVYADDSIIFSSSSVNVYTYDTPKFTTFTDVVFPPSASSLIFSSSLTEYVPSGCATSSFDPTLSGDLTLYHWYDFTDCSTMNFLINEITSITDKGNAPTTASLIVSASSYYSGPTFQGSNSGSLFNSNKFDWKGLQTNTVPSTMVSQGEERTYVTILEIVSGSEGRDPTSPPNELHGTVVFGANSSHTGYRSIQPVLYGTGSFGDQNYVNGDIGEGNIRLGSGIQRLSTNDLNVTVIRGATSGSEYFVSSIYHLDYDGNDNSKFGNVNILYDVTGSQSIGEFTGQTIQSPYATQFSIGYSPMNDDDVSRTRIKHVMIFSGSLTGTEKDALYAEWLNTKL